MKFGITIILLFLSGMAWSSETQPPSNNNYPYYGNPYGVYQNNVYQANAYQNTYYQQGYYPVNNSANAVYPEQNQYGYYRPPAYQAPAYYAPGYSYPAYQNQYAYPNYYQAPYQEQFYAPEAYRNTDSTTTGIPKTVKRKAIDKIKTKQPVRLSNKTIKKLTRSEHKKQFFNQILPLVINENRLIQKDRKRMLSILNELDEKKIISAEEKLWLKQLAKKYRISGNIYESISLQQELIKRVNGISPSMALAQAANESAWGTSRFSRQGNNLFGIWTYNEKIGIKPLKREPGKKHFVRKFSSFQESVIVYMHTLNTHAAYKKLRGIRHQAVLKGKKLSGYELAKGLEKYSARGLDYIKMIQMMINNYDLENMKSENIALPEIASN